MATIIVEVTEELKKEALRAKRVHKVCMSELVRSGMRSELKRLNDEGAACAGAASATGAKNGTTR